MNEYQNYVMNEKKELQAKLAAAERERDELRAANKTLHEACRRTPNNWCPGIIVDDTTGERSGCACDCPECEQTRKERDSLAAKVQELEAKCAEMRDAIKEPVWFCNSAKCTNIDGHNPSCAITKRDHALSSDCGRDYVPRKELDEAREISKKYEDRYFSTKAELEKETTEFRAEFYAIEEGYRVKIQLLESALKECVEALENYGNHRAHCQLGYSDQKCNCGFYEALAKAKEVL